MGVTITNEAHGVAHCFRCGFVESWREERQWTSADRKVYAESMKAIRKQHEADVHQRQAEAATAAALRWAAARQVEVHQYLSAKGVIAHGLRLDGNCLLVPVRDSRGHLMSLQTIAPDGTKRFTAGGRTKGGYHAIGKPSERLLICEGYATGATLYEASGHAVAIAFNSGNLLPVAKVLRAKFPSLTLVLAADDDWQTPGNPGLTAATEAARAVGGLLAVPNFAGLPRGPKDSDFNDVSRLARAAEVQG